MATREQWERDPHDPDTEWRYDPKWGLTLRNKYAPHGTTGNSTHPGTRERIALWHRLAFPPPPAAGGET